MIKKYIISLIIPSSFFLLLLNACSPFLFTKAELQGADPQYDLMAAPLSKKLITLSALGVSVKGVKLLNPLRRAFQLWGKPSSKQRGSYLWLGKDGFQLRILTAKLRKVERINDRDEARWVEVIVRIDIFAVQRIQFHPENRALLEEKKIRSLDWRMKVIGSKGIKRFSNLKESYIYPLKGFRFVLFSPLLPEGKKLKALFGLFLPEKIRLQKNIFPLS